VFAFAGDVRRLVFVVLFVCACVVSTKLGPNFFNCFLQFLKNYLPPYRYIVCDIRGFLIRCMLGQCLSLCPLPEPQHHFWLSQIKIWNLCLRQDCCLHTDRNWLIWLVHSKVCICPPLPLPPPFSCALRSASSSFLSFLFHFSCSFFANGLQPSVTLRGLPMTSPSSSSSSSSSTAAVSL